MNVIVRGVEVPRRGGRVRASEWNAGQSVAV